MLGMLRRRAGGVSLPRVLRRQAVFAHPDTSRALVLLPTFVLNFCCDNEIREMSKACEENVLGVWAA